MSREYVAYVEGRPTTPTGTWRNWLTLSANETAPVHRPADVAKAPDTEALEAVTHYEVIREFPVAGGPAVVTKLRLRLETGRKHQIRAQTAHAGLPLLGDRPIIRATATTHRTRRGSSSRARPCTRSR